MSALMRADRRRARVRKGMCIVKHYATEYGSSEIEYGGHCEGQRRVEEVMMAVPSSRFP